MRSFFTFQIRNTILFTEAELQAKVDVPHTIAMLCCPDVLLCLFLHLFHIDTGSVILHRKNNILFLSSRADPDLTAFNIRFLRNPMDDRIFHKWLENNIETCIALQFFRYIYLERNGVIKVIIFDIDINLNMLDSPMEIRLFP